VLVLHDVSVAAKYGKEWARLTLFNASCLEVNSHTSKPNPGLQQDHKLFGKVASAFRVRRGAQVLGLEAFNLHRVGSAFIRNGRKLFALIGLVSPPFHNQGQSNR
jgi:hypothetical protein